MVWQSFCDPQISKRQINKLQSKQSFFFLCTTKTRQSKEKEKEKKKDKR